MSISQATSAWLHGLVAAAITSFSTAGMAFLTMPDTFNFSGHGLENAAKIVIAPTIVSVLAYLKSSPLPGPATLQVQNPQITPQGLSGSSATLSMSSEVVQGMVSQQGSTAPTPVLTTKSASITVNPPSK